MYIYIFPSTSTLLDLCDLSKTLRAAKNDFYHKKLHKSNFRVLMMHWDLLYTLKIKRQLTTDINLFKKKKK